jgi:hypothetical protein
VRRERGIAGEGGREVGRGGGEERGNERREEEKEGERRRGYKFGKSDIWSVKGAESCAAKM